MKHVYEDLPWFGTRGRLIVDIAVSPCSVYLFLYLFYSTGEPATGDKPGGGCHIIHRAADPETAAYARTLPLIDKGFLQKRMAIDSTVASTGLFLLFYFFSLIRMLITFSRPTSQGAGCLHVAFLPMRRRNPLPLGLSIRKLNILDSRGFGLAQAIWKVELGGLDIIPILLQLFSYT